MAVKNMAASVLTRLKNQSKEEGVPFQMVLQLFAQEEFLRKLSLSQYAENLILKGGMFIYTLTEFDSRPTRDIDFLIKNLDGSLENIEQAMRDICNISTGNDFITLEVLGTETISVNKKYPGVKTSFMSHIGNVRIPFAIDVGIDDVIVPDPIKRTIITRLPDFASPEVLTYSLESTVAEKFDAILQRMAGTSRMKDFYDIYYLSGIFDFEGEILIEAVKSTLAHRNRELSDDVFAEIEDFKNNDALNTQWKAFDPAKESGLLLEDVLDRLAVFLEPIYQNIRSETNYDKRWSCENKMWMQSYAFGVDLGGTTVKIGFFQTDGTLLEKWEIPTRKEKDGDFILQDIADAIRDYLKRKSVSMSEVEGIGIAVPGAVLAGGIVNRCVNLGWGVRPVAEELSTLLGGVCVRVANDANAAALGEIRYTKKWKSIVLLTLGTGIGGGVIVDGKIVTGAFGGGGEIGHMPVGTGETELCGCGKKGCLEQYASASGIVRLAVKCLEKTKEETALRTVCPLTAKDVFDSAQNGDPVARGLVDEICEILGRAMASVACVVDPEAFVLGGGVSGAGEILIDTVQTYYRKYAFHTSRETEIVLAELGNDAGMYGAMQLIRT